jgi:hypothetical protein
VLDGGCPGVWFACIALRGPLFQLFSSTNLVRPGCIFLMAPSILDSSVSPSWLKERRSLAHFPKNGQSKQPALLSDMTAIRGFGCGAVAIAMRWSVGCIVSLRRWQLRLLCERSCWAAACLADTSTLQLGGCLSRLPLGMDCRPPSSPRIKTSRGHQVLTAGRLPSWLQSAISKDNTGRFPTMSWGASK